ncbi:arginine:ornithine antiporter [Aerococcus viridans]|uniref:Arginine:ornithine antiporter n=2 Tax=Aerococcaceae TaxID=186827 RepID=A0A2J9PPI0_9LACT|nr:YfcC family protein [Aerococcus sp.]PNL91900.1 arginine:ornithine antiporter [Aerococcus viridans]
MAEEQIKQGHIDSDAIQENNQKDNKKTGKKFKMPNSFTILMIITAIIAVLTWIVPAGQYDTTADGSFIAGTYYTIDQVPQGIWQVLSAPFIGMIGNDLTQGAIEISLFILVLGGFLNVVTQTGAIDAGINAVIQNNKNNMTRLIWILMFIFALGGSSYGMAEETIPFYALLIPLMVTVGYDSLVAVAVILVGSGLGVLSSTVNPFATGIASSMAGIGLGEGILPRVIMFVIMYIIGAFYVSRYASKVLEDPKNSLIYDQMDEQKEKFKVKEDLGDITSTQKSVLTLFILGFVIMIMGLIPWTDLSSNLTFFEDFHGMIMGTPILGDLIGQSLLPFGSWYLSEITVLFFLMSIIIGFVAKIPEEKFINDFIDGTKDILSVALICAVARGIQVIMNDGQITATVLHWGELLLANLSSGIFIAITYIFYIPMSFLIPSTSGLAAATMGIMAPLGNFAGVAESLIVTAYQSAAGLVNLITPTSGVVMGALAIAGIELTTWWKFMAKLIAGVFLVSVVLLVAFALLGL